MKSLKEMLPETPKIYFRTARAYLLSLDLRPRSAYALPPEEQQATSAISVVVPVHDALEVTARCLDSLERFGGEAEIIIVDDGSKLEVTRQFLDDRCAQNGWKLIRNERPQGHSRASEAGVAVSSRPFLCLLNSDAIVTPHSWAGVVSAFETSARIAVVGPVTSFTAGTQQIAARACLCRHYWSDAEICCFAERYVARHRMDPLVEVSFVGGFAFFVRRSVWDDLGGFDTHLPDYGNETEFCRRVHRAGLRQVITRAAYVHHLGNVSYGKTLGRAAIHDRSLNAKRYIQDMHG
jgi:GT2 family glycosyltransferase